MSQPVIRSSTTESDPGVSRAATAVIAIVVVAVVSLAALLARSDAPSTGVGAAPSSSEPVVPVAPTGNTTEATVTVDGMAYVPAVIEVPAGDRLLLTLENTGEQRHDLVLANGAALDPVPPGASATLDAGVIGADLDGWCSLTGHRQMGMTLRIVAVGAASLGADHHGHAATDPVRPDAEVPSAAELIAAARAAEPAPAELPALAAATEHRYTFRVTEDHEDVAAGLTRAVWTYNGSSPGPVLHGRVGDTFHITLVNDGTMGHSIDFHAGDVAPDEPMRTIEPGERLEYTFVARRAGIWMYHCSTMPMSNHIANGMFGAVVIEPDGLPPVDRSYVVVQSELYLGADGEPADADKVAGTLPDVVTFNGRAFQYDAHPLTAAVGERVRMWVLDAGPNAPLSFHVVGTQFDTVWTEGAYSVLGGTAMDGATAGESGAQVLPLLAAQGGFVEFVPREPGHYPFVNHIMSLAEKGAHGVLLVEDASLDE